MRAGVHVGVDAQAHLRRAAHGHRLLRQQLQLALAFDVEAAHAGLQRAAHLGAGLADAGEDHLARHRRRRPARAPARPPRRCRSRSRPARRSAARPGWGWPSSRNTAGAAGRPARAGRRPPHRAWRAANTRTAACRTRAPARRASSRRAAGRRPGAPGRGRRAGSSRRPAPRRRWPRRRGQRERALLAAAAGQAQQQPQGGHGDASAPRQAAPLHCMLAVHACRGFYRP